MSKTISCPNCGKEIQKDFKVCPYCMIELEVSSDEEELFIDLICNKNDVKYNGYSLSGNVLFTEKEALKDDNVFFGLVVNTCTELGANITITIE